MARRRARPIPHKVKMALLSLMFHGGYMKYNAIVKTYSESQRTLLDGTTLPSKIGRDTERDMVKRGFAITLERAHVWRDRQYINITQKGREKARKLPQYDIVMAQLVSLSL